MTEKQQQSLFDRIYGLRSDLISISQELFFTGSLVYKAKLTIMKQLKHIQLKSLLKNAKGINF